VISIIASTEREARVAAEVALGSRVHMRVISFVMGHDGAFRRGVRRYTYSSHLSRSL
jgi:hypothetical protein